MSQIIVVTSGKGGVGKTVFSANIGLGIAKLGHKVVLLDADIGLRNLDIALGLENRVVYDLVDVLNKECSLDTALLREKHSENLFLLPASQMRDRESVSVEQLQGLCENLAEEFEYVIIDCPTGIDNGFKNSVRCADRAIILTAPDASSMRDADRVVGLLENYGVTDYALVINRIYPELAKNGELPGVDNIISKLNIDLLGVVPEDTDVIISSNKGEPVILNTKSLAGLAFENIAKRIIGENVPLTEFKKSAFRRKTKVKRTKKR